MDYGAEAALVRGVLARLGARLPGVRFRFACVPVTMDTSLPLKDAVKAHEAIESGKTLGATVLIP